MRWIAVIAVLAALLIQACADRLVAAERVVDTQTGRIRVEPVASGLDHPWGLAFLPDGGMLVTERPGRLRLIADGRLSPPLRSVPAVLAQGQGGLLDVAIDPDFATSRLVYLSYAEPGDGGAGTAVARGRLNDARTALENVQVIFRQQPKVSGGGHFGSRLVFARDGTLFITTGERFRFDAAQDLNSHLGKIIRINRDGSVPRDNPFVGRSGAKPEIWAYGIRNSQGAALHPETGQLWEVEHGPRGGDELNIIEAGKNYGWPLVSWGRHYSGQAIAEPSTRSDLAQPIRHWTPVISPAGMAFYTGSLFTAWRGNLIVGGLTAGGPTRLTLDGARVTGEERINLGQRIRDVRQGPDGAVYLLADASDGAVLRLTPAR
ncbi:MAG TPA: PQQ-dependent sugar dehydrogenase [Alphaproteobacteria bacterium]|nr:PQQ-dependent sugar dehydrogenase [Alphaproteobacteria bacterium]